MSMSQIYFTADLHFGHANILKHSPNRPYTDSVDIVAHDEWLLDLWQSTVDRRDTVYILGKLDDYNAQSMDLRFDVGIDGNWAGLRFLTLEDIYNAAARLFFIRNIFDIILFFVKNTYICSAKRNIERNGQTI